MFIRLANIAVFLAASFIYVGFSTAGSLDQSVVDAVAVLNSLNNGRSTQAPVEQKRRSPASLCYGANPDPNLCEGESLDQLEGTVDLAVSVALTAAPAPHLAFGAIQELLPQIQDPSQKRGIASEQ